MARIDGASPRRAGLFGRFAYWAAKRRLGKVAEPLAVVAHPPVDSSRVRRLRARS